MHPGDAGGAVLREKRYLAAVHRLAELYEEWATAPVQTAFADGSEQDPPVRQHLADQAMALARSVMWDATPLSAQTAPELLGSKVIAAAAMLRCNALLKKLARLAEDWADGCENLRRKESYELDRLLRELAEARHGFNKAIGGVYGNGAIAAPTVTEIAETFFAAVDINASTDAWADRACEYCGRGHA